MQTLSLDSAVLARRRRHGRRRRAPRTARRARRHRSSPPRTRFPNAPDTRTRSRSIEVKLGGEAMTDAEQVTRWLDELKAGRARAGALVGSHLAYLALTPGGLRRGPRRAHPRRRARAATRPRWQLAQLADNRSCGEVDVAAMERWLKKAVTLDYLAAAQRLIAAVFADGSENRSRAAVRVRARRRRILGSGLSARKATRGSRAGFDVAALQEMEKTLSAGGSQARGNRGDADPHADAETARSIQAGAAAGIQPRRKGRKGVERLGLRRLHDRLPPRVRMEPRRQLPRRAAPRVRRHRQQRKGLHVLQGGIAVQGLRHGRAGQSFARNARSGPTVTRRLVVGDVYEQPDKSSRWR